MNEILYKLFGFIAYSLFYICLMLICHEQAHKEIYRFYDIKSKIVRTNLLSYEIRTENIKNISKQKLRDVMFLQSLNEIVGYPLIAFGYVVLSFAYLVVF